MRFRSIGLIITLALGILLAPLATDAQQSGKVYRIGALFGGSESGTVPIAEAFRQGLSAAGYEDGRSIFIEFRYADGKFDRLPDLAAELVRQKVDVIVAPTTPAALAAQKATATIPIITVAVADPVASGLVTSLGRPGGNITGLTLLPGPEIVGKYLELLKEAVPKVSRVAMLWNPGQQVHPLLLKEAEGPARLLKLVLRPMEARGPGELESAFGGAAREGAGALVVLPDPMFFSERARMATLAAKHRLPAMYGVREHVEAGGLMAYGPNVPDLFRRAAVYVDKILKGGKPADLPVERPTKFEFIINLKTAKALGLTIPPSVLVRADQVIQ